MMTYCRILMGLALTLIVATTVRAEPVRVFQSADGSVRIMHLNMKYCQSPHIPTQCLDREQAKDLSLVGLPFADTDSASLPSERVHREKWRTQTGRVVVDPTAPSPPHPRQALLDEISAATTVGQLKAALQKMIQAR